MNRSLAWTVLPVVTLALVLLVLAPVAVAANTTVSFELDGPQVTANPNTGATIRTTGGGSFDPSAGTVVASGSFAELNPNGSVAARANCHIPTTYATLDRPGLDLYRAQPLQPAR